MWLSEGVSFKTTMLVFVFCRPSPEPRESAAGRRLARGARLRLEWRRLRWCATSRSSRLRPQQTRIRPRARASPPVRWRFRFRWLRGSRGAPRCRSSRTSPQSDARSSGVSTTLLQINTGFWLCLDLREHRVGEQQSKVDDDERSHGL